MKISEMIYELAQIQHEYGDVDVCVENENLGRINAGMAYFSERDEVAIVCE